MTAAVIGASSESIYVISKAKELGLFVVALDGNPEAPGLKAADASFVVDIRNADEVIKVLEDYDVKVILPVPIGRYLTTTGIVNDHFGLTGVSGRSAELCTDKYEFHRVLAQKNLRDAELYLIPAGETDSYPEELNVVYPVVVKPRFGSGSRGVEIFNSQEELLQGFISGEPYDEDYVIETCIPGPEYGLDGVFEDGRFKLILLRGKENTPPPYRECVAYYSLDITGRDKVFADNVRSYMQAVGEAMGFKNNIIHADIIRKDNDKPFLIETSARPSGHNLHNLFTPLASGVDEVTEFIKLAVPELNMPHSFEPSVQGNVMIHYFNFEKVRITRVPTEDYIRGRYPVKDYKCTIKEGDHLGMITDGASLMGRGYFVITGSSVEELKNISKQIMIEFGSEEMK